MHRWASSSGSPSWTLKNYLTWVILKDCDSRETEGCLRDAGRLDVGLEGLEDGLPKRVPVARHGLGGAVREVHDGLRPLRRQVIVDARDDGDPFRGQRPVEGERLRA